MFNTDNQFDAFLTKPRGDRVFRVQISRNTLIAIIVSLLIHAIILLSVLPKFEQDQAAELPARELEVSLAPPTPEKKNSRKAGRTSRHAYRKITRTCKAATQSDYAKTSGAA